MRIQTERENRRKYLRINFVITLYADMICAGLGQSERGGQDVTQYDVIRSFVINMTNIIQTLTHIINIISERLCSHDITGAGRGY